MQLWWSYTRLKKWALFWFWLTNLFSLKFGNLLLLINSWILIFLGASIEDSCKKRRGFLFILRQFYWTFDIAFNIEVTKEFMVENFCGCDSLIIVDIENLCDQVFEFCADLHIFGKSILTQLHFFQSFSNIHALKRTISKLHPKQNHTNRPNIRRVWITKSTDCLWCNIVGSSTALSLFVIGISELASKAKISQLDLIIFS